MDKPFGHSSLAVTVAIPTFNSEAHLEAAVRSALDQTLKNLEVIIVDDGSSDGTFALSQRLAQADGRIRVDRLPNNGGPSVARNRAMELAKGRWFAVLDSDDLFARDRLRRLVEVGEAQGADVIADNLVVFESDDPSRATFFLDAADCSGWLTIGSYLQRTVMCSHKPNFGYLKPIMRLDRLKQFDIRYNPDLRIAEDDDLIVRLLAEGLRYWLEPSATYAYRRHAASTSHRLSASRAASIVEAGRVVVSDWRDLPSDTRAALLARVAAFERAAGFARLIEALKARQFVGATREALRNPQILPLLRMPLAAAFRRALGIAAASDFGKPDPQAAAKVAEILTNRGVDGTGLSSLASLSR